MMDFKTKKFSIPNMVEMEKSKGAARALTNPLWHFRVTGLRTHYCFIAAINFPSTIATAHSFAFMDHGTARRKTRPDFLSPMFLSKTGSLQASTKYLPMGSPGEQK